MNHKFPEEIQRLIFEFDPTKRETLSRIVHQIKLSPVLETITTWSNRQCFLVDR